MKKPRRGGRKSDTESGKPPLQSAKLNDKLRALSKARCPPPAPFSPPPPSPYPQPPTDASDDPPQPCRDPQCDHSGKTRSPCLEIRCIGSANQAPPSILPRTTAAPSNGRRSPALRSSKFSETAGIRD